MSPYVFISHMRGENDLDPISGQNRNAIAVIWFPRELIFRQNLKSPRRTHRAKKIFGEGILSVTLKRSYLSMIGNLEFSLTKKN